MNGIIGIQNNLNNKKLVLYDGVPGENATTATNFYGFGINNGMLRYQTDSVNSAHAFFGGATEIMRIVSGRVGIGTTSPIASLHVVNSLTTTSATQAAFTQTTTDFGEGTILSCNGSTTEIKMNNGMSSHFTISNDGAFKINNTSSSPNPFTPGMNILTILTNGNMGIGTTNPQQTLQVNGNIILSGMTNGYQQPGSRFIGLGSINGAVGVDGFTGMEIQSVNANGNYSQNIRFWNHHNTTGTGGTPRMTIQYDGKVGIGTTNPVSPLHVFRSTSGTLASFIGNGIGGNNYNFDFCAYLSSGGIPTNRIACIDDGNFSGHYAFYSKTPGADTNPLVERMRISSNGFIGIPQLLTTNENLVSIDCVNSAAVDALGCRSQSDGNNIINFYNTAGALKGHVGSSNSSSVSYNSGSDRRLKENITDMGSMINKIKQLKPRHFNWISGGEKDDGFIAQELFNVLPQLRPINAFKCKTISHNEKYDGKVCSCCDLENPKRNSNGAPYIYGVDYGKLTPYLVKAIQEQQTQIEQLENTIKSQQSQIDMLLKRLENAGF